MKLPSILTTPPPSAALFMGPGQVSAVAFSRVGGEPVVAAHASEPLRPGAVTPVLTGQNIADRAGVLRVVSSVLGQLGGRHRRIALVLPDAVAKVSLVRLSAVPAHAQDREQLIRWHVRKSAPFPIEEAQVACSAGVAIEDGGREFVVAVARRAVVREYESVCEEAGAHAGLVDLATLSLVNAVLATARNAQGDWLVVHVSPGSGSIAILRGGDLIFFRTRVEGSDDTLPDLVHQTAMYYEDRLEGHGFARVLIAGGDGDTSGGFDEVRRQVDARLGVRTETVDPRRIMRFSDRVDLESAVLNTMAPLLGVAAGAGAGE
jgi:Tfp pilus assembly PilM family ATPase